MEQIKIALAGNPNCGKTTLFNALTGSNQYVGNWPGVTVEKKEGRLKGDKTVTITDLPGIYSLSPYSPEEVISRNYITQEKPDAIINIVDASNLERNLYLTTQVIEMGVPVVLALNMMDIVHKNGDEVNASKLEKELGVPVVEISALKNNGIDKLIAAAKDAARNNRLPEPKQSFGSPMIARSEDEEDEIITARYDFIAGVIGKCSRKKSPGLTTSDKIDRIVTNRWLALPIFAVVMFIVYYVAMSTVGAMATDWVNDVLFGEWIIPGAASLLESINCASWLSGLIVDGIITGVGAVLGFIPQMLVLFILLAFLEYCGYMARIAFVLDRIFRKFGLSGKSFIPMLVATGCGVPGVMASRTIENERDRRMTVITTTFIPCGAKLPIIGLIAGALFGGSALISVASYFIGVAAVIVSGIILKKTKMFAGDPAPFVMELPAYHLPTVGSVLRSMWERGWSFIKKAGTIILLSTIIVWFLLGFGVENGSFGMVEDIDNSILAAVGSAISWIFKPLGWGNWKSAVAAVSGLVAKENVVATFAQLFHFAGEVAENGDEIWGELAASFTALSGFSYLIFNLLCAPCFAAIGAIKREMNSAKWTWFAIGYQCVFAYVIALIVYQFGMLFTGAGNVAGTIAAVVLTAVLLYFLFRPDPTKKLQRTAAANEKVKV